MSLIDDIAQKTYLKEVISNDEMNKIETALNHIISKIKDVEKINSTYSISKCSNITEIVMVYSSICMLLGESKELLDVNVDWDEISYKYMAITRDIIQQMPEKIPTSLFGGYAEIGFGAYSLYKSTNHYNQFVHSLNKIIIQNVYGILQYSKSNFNDMYASVYDTISGLAGIAGYLLLFKDETEVKKCIEEILKYFVLLTKDKEVFGENVPGWYIPSKNQYSEKEKIIYKKGNFNLSLSHGVSGILAILSLALNENIEVRGQKESIKKILVILKKFYYTNKSGGICWLGRMKFEDYVSGKYEKDNPRASWCYGTPGIARTMYLGGEAINDTECVELSIKAFESICVMNQEELMLDSPIICHGYAGLLATIQAMYFDTKNPMFYKETKTLLMTLLNFYDHNSKFGFYNIEPKNIWNNEFELVQKDNIAFLEGAIGVILPLLVFIKPIKTDWMRHLLII